MIVKKCLIYFLIVLQIAYPVSAGDVTLNRWALNITLHDDSLVEEVIQIEIDNAGSLPLDGFSFVVPASAVTMKYDFEHTSSFTGQVVEQQPVPGGIKLTINFNMSVEAGKKWNGRIGFIAENWARKEGTDYSIDIPIDAPQAIISGTSTIIAIPENSEIRSQVFLPKSVEVISVTPEPFRILFQYDRMVPTWSPDKLTIGDTISIKGSFSDVLSKIVEVDERSRELSTRIEEAKAKGMDVSQAEAHLANAEVYNTNQALQSFWKKEDSVALEYNGYANDELKKAETSLENAGKTGTVPQKTPVEEQNGKQNPGPGAITLIIIVSTGVLIKRKK